MKTYGFNKTTSEKISSLINQAEDMLERCPSSREASVSTNEQQTQEAHCKRCLDVIVNTLMTTEAFIYNSNTSHLYTRDRVILAHLLHVVNQTMLRADILAVAGFFDMYNKLYTYGQYLAEVMLTHKDPKTYKMVVLTDKKVKTSKAISLLFDGEASDRVILDELKPLLSKNDDKTEDRNCITNLIEEYSSISVAVSVVEFRPVSKRNVIVKDSSSKKKVIFRRTGDLRLKI